jgi:hypothetical protein
MRKVDAGWAIAGAHVALIVLIFVTGTRFGP